MRQEDKSIPSILNYKVYEASNVTNIKISPSYCIDKDVYGSLEDLRNFEL